MADLYCQRCGEPWDMYGVYNDDMDKEEKKRFLAGIDCPHCHGKEVKEKPFRATLASAMADILGDDTDGIAVEMEDAAAYFGGEFWG